MIRIAILDDEKADLEKEEQITRQYFYNRQAESEIATYQSVEWFLLGLTEEQFDIYILDAEMPVKNGIEVAKEIRKLYPEPVIIYVTNHLNYAVEAYEVNTYRYIAKDTMEKGLNAAYETLLPILLAKEERYYIVKKRSELEKIAYSDIFYVKKEGKCAVIVHRNGETSVRDSLSAVEKALGSREFIVADRGYLANIRHMKDRKQREELLQVLHKKGETQLQKELRDYEIQSLLELDIPYFEIDGNSRSIFDGNGKEYQGYLPCTPYESWIEHMKQLSCQDMEQQCDYIRLSMGLLNHGYIGEKNPRWADENTCIHQIAEWICRTAVIDGADIGWAGLHFWDNGYWSLKPCGMYLYDGIAGIVLFLAKYLDRYQDSSCRQDVEKIYKLAIEKLEKYTDLRCEQNEVPEPLATGLYDGESSIVYVYLILYEITGQEKWIKNAQKHFEIVAKLLPKDENMDYLSGNAGAIVAAMKLYQLTGEIEYCTAAVETEKDLWKKGQRMEVGYGWKLKNLKYPLSGLSHGNSGFLMAYVELYKMTYDQEYLKKIKLLLSYEDILYSEDLKNWIDLRDPDGRKTMRGWCHGAPGILLSRMSIMDILPDDKQIKKDILRAVSTLFHNEREKKICLCHGMTGNLLIMKKYLEKNPDDDLRQKYERQFSNLKEQLQDMRSLMVTETLNPAFMNGITGVGMAMMLLNMD